MKKSLLSVAAFVLGLGVAQAQVATQANISMAGGGGGGGGGGANTALSNLAAVAVNQSLVPGADNTIGLGTSALRWAGVQSTEFVARLDNTNTLKTSYRTDGITTNHGGSTYIIDAATSMDILSLDGEAVVINSTSNLQVNAPAGVELIPGATFTVFIGLDGTALLPSLTLGTVPDLNTGFFHPAADVLATSTAGVERMRVTATGEVGIGNAITPATNEMLRIERNGNFGISTTIENTTSGTLGLSAHVLKSAVMSLSLYTFSAGYTGSGMFQPSSSLIRSGGNMYLGAAGAQPIILFTNDTERMRIISTGEVGIGASITPPSNQMLRIERNGNFGITKYIANTTLGTAALAQSVLLSGSSGLELYAFNSSYTGLNVSQPNSGQIRATGSLYVGTASNTLPVVFFSFDTERARMHGATGNWSLGTVTDLGSLAVDNGAVAESIFVARDNGTPVFTVGDGGLVTATRTLTGAAANHFLITSTLEAAGTNQTAIRHDVTGAATGAVAALRIGHQLVMGSGYNGTGLSQPSQWENNSAGTGNDLRASTSASTPLGNGGVNGFSYGTNTGLNWGGFGEAANGTLNLGHYAKAITLKNSATNIGVLALALNTGTTPINVGGYFGLQNTTPTFISAALMADNGTTTDPVMVLRDNGVAAMVVIDGGNVGIGTSVPGNPLTVTYDGTVAVPTISMGAGLDTNTGIFHPAAETIAFTNNGTETMRLNSTNDVGIGVTPTERLSVKDHTAFAGSETQLTTGAVQTTTNAQLNAIIITLSDTSVYWLEADVVGRRTDVVGDRVHYKFSALCYREGGGAVIEAQTNMITQESAGAGAFDSVFTASGNACRVTVQGDTGKTVNWAATLTYQLVSGST